MNPRYRRLLIPGLLLALVVVVVIAALTGRAQAEEAKAQDVSVIDDERISEASGMVASRTDDDLVYIVNDSGQAQAIYAVEISTGDVVGVTAVTGGTWRDTEALSIDADGTLWVADTGDNLVQRDDLALYSLPEPGRGDQTVAATRYPVAFPDGREDVEALLIDPDSGAKYLISKGFGGGDVYELPERLSTREVNVAERVADAPAIVTDAAFSSDGKRVLVRTYLGVSVHDPEDFSETRDIAVPSTRQGETLAVETSGTSFLIGSEGVPSPLIRVDLSAPAPTATPTETPSPVPVDDRGEPRSSNGFAGRTATGGAIALVVLAGIGWWAARNR